MFERLEMAPPDAILGLKVAFAQDLNPDKINLSVGVYKDAKGKTPIMRSVKLAEAQILEQESTKSYLGIPGSNDYAQAVQALLLGPQHEAIATQRAMTAHAPGGTGALRVAADFLTRIRPGTRIWVSEPTWPNHPNVFRAGRLEVSSYPYFDPQRRALDVDAMVKAIAEMPAGDVILLHGCCHNPTGTDPTPEEWAQIADAVAEAGVVPLVDFAYQGLGDGLREDRAGILALCRPGAEMMVASSFSKNFGLYNERVGALTVVTPSPEAAKAALSHVEKVIRANYSNPPAHGAAIVTTILNDPTLREMWEDEVAEMCSRILEMRDLFARTLAARGVQQDFDFVRRQRGMFSFSGLTPDQVQALRDQHSAYIIGNGRINVAGMTEANMDALCTAIAAVLNDA